MIFALHGKDGNGKDSTLCKEVRKYFTDEVVYCPSYDSSLSHKEIAEQLDAFVENITQYDKGEEVIFVGCSMGGYWARYLANKHNACKLMMINPSLELYEEGIKEDNPSLPILVFLGMKDEVVNPQVALNIYENRACVIKIQNGDHRMLNEYVYILPEIEREINTYID